MPRPFLLIIVNVLAMTLGYGIFIEPQMVRVKTVTVRNNAFSNLFNNKKILQISDLHLDENNASITRKILAVIKEINPEIILLTGDYVQWFADNRNYTLAHHFLKKLKDHPEVYAVLGDADLSNSREYCAFCHRSETDPSPASHHVKFLKNTGKLLKTEKGEFLIYGLFPEKEALAQAKKNLPDFAPNLPIIILSHTSEIYSSIPDSSNVLVVAGDSHGGQVFLPNMLWPLLRLLPDPKHLYGLFTENKKNLYVSCGVGTSHLPFRLGMPPEIILFHFDREVEQKI